MSYFDLLIVKPLLRSLEFFYALTSSALWSVFLLTLLVRVLFLPLNVKALRSQKKLQKLAGKVKKLQEKYKNDKEKLSQEVLKLYAEAKVNPFLPFVLILVQLPVWIGLYRMLLSEKLPFALETSFLGFSLNLSAPSVLVGGAAVLLQFLLTLLSSSGLSPFTFSFLFLSFLIFIRLPAIITLYILFSTLLSLIETGFVLEWGRIINQIKPKKDVRRDPTQHHRDQKKNRGILSKIRAFSSPDHQERRGDNQDRP